MARPSQYRFASGSLNQYLSISFEAKFPEQGDVKADDPEKTLYEFIPPSYSKNLDAFEATVEKDAREFKPLGTCIGAYRTRSAGAGADKGKGKGKGRSEPGPVLPEREWEPVEDPEQDDDDDDDEVRHEAYWANWDTPGFREYHRRMQIFVLLYIEGASYIDEEDGRWEFVTLCVPPLSPLSLALSRPVTSTDCDDVYQVRAAEKGRRHLVPLHGLRLVLLVFLLARHQAAPPRVRPTPLSLLFDPLERN